MNNKFNFRVFLPATGERLEVASLEWLVDGLHFSVVRIVDKNNVQIAKGIIDGVTALLMLEQCTAAKVDESDRADKMSDAPLGFITIADKHNNEGRSVCEVIGIVAIKGRRWPIVILPCGRSSITDPVTGTAIAMDFVLASAIDAAKVKLNSQWGKYLDMTMGAKSINPGWQA